MNCNDFTVELAQGALRPFHVGWRFEEVISYYYLIKAFAKMSSVLGGILK
jgi:hypothetical protein